MKRYSIEKYRSYESVKIDDSSLNETDAFISRFLNDENYADDLNTILYWIDKIGQNGVLERYFRPETLAEAIPIDTGNNLRLYCSRMNDNILILGNGGIKTSQLVKDSPDCIPHFELMNHVAKKLYWSIKDEKTLIERNEMKGKLNFKFPEK